MKHYGDITKINGAEVEPVAIYDENIHGSSVLQVEGR